MTLQNNMCENNNESEIKTLKKAMEKLTEQLSHLTYEIGYMARMMREQVEYQRYSYRYRDLPPPWIR